MRTTNEIGNNITENALVALEDAIQSLNETDMLTGGGFSLESSYEDLRNLPQTGVLEEQLHEFILNFTNESEENIPQYVMENMIAAGTIAGYLSNNPKEWRKSLNDISIEDAEKRLVHCTHSGQGGTNSFVDFESYMKVTTESFDLNEFQNKHVLNIVLNMVAARQHPALEAIFPTKVMPPNQDTLVFNITKEEAIINNYHPTDGGPIELHRMLLRDTRYDPDAFLNNNTRLIPWKNPDGSVDQFFMSSTVIAPTNFPIDKITSVPTAPLKFGVEFNALGLSQHPGYLKNNRLDNTDQIAFGHKITAIYGVVGNQAIRFPIAHLINCSYRKAEAGHHRETWVNIMSDDIMIDYRVLDTARAPIAAMNPIVANNLVVRCSVSVNGRLNLHTGMGETNCTSLKVREIRDPLGNLVPLTSPQGQAVVAAVASIEMDGFDLEYYASNTNWRFSGPSVDIVSYSEYVVIPPCSPYTIFQPVDTQNNAAKLNAMRKLINIENTHRGFTAMFNYIGHVKEYQEAQRRGIAFNLQGIGRECIRPTVVQKQIDVLQSLTSMDTMYADDGISAVFKNHIKHALIEAINESRYKTYLEDVTGNPSIVPNFALLTDMTTVHYMFDYHFKNLNQDNVLSSVATVKSYSLIDPRFDKKIYLIPTMGPEGVNNLTTFGVHGFVAEMVHERDEDREGRVVRRTSMIPRNYHIPILPFAICFDVINLEEAIKATKCKEECPKSVVVVNSPTPTP